ncbi:restriction endonuclease [Coprococcus sp. AM14-16]|uniref:BsuBI/PstI family type II restriction endonuclease n=1 Tax=Coprococcus TaxID=33042 RepID=UPI000E407C1D|nr:MULTISPECIES: BsuBI/PstI family type II restriction endonuclease [Coprococcus]RGD39237.1 restriction endonuclease [Coprococcus sp. AM14-16]
MDKKIEETREFLQTIGMPKAQQADICCYVILAMAGIKPDMSWSEATNEWIRIHDIIQFVNTFYGMSYAENSRETFRKQALHRFRTAALIEDNGKATNSPNYRYRLTEETIKILITMETLAWKESIKRFLYYHEKLIDLYASKKKMTMMPVNINGESFKFSAGKHNELQKAIIEEFAPRFAPNSECLYVGDTIEKDLVKNVEKLKELGFEITLHDKMPDVVLYREDKNWIYFVESVTSVGPMDPKRILEITEMTKDVTAGKVFVTAFLDFKTYKKFAEKLAWETEVWIAEMPEHMIHLNGDRFMGPRE